MRSLVVGCRLAVCRRWEIGRQACVRGSLLGLASVGEDVVVNAAEEGGNRLVLFDVRRPEVVLLARDHQ